MGNHGNDHEGFNIASVFFGSYRLDASPIRCQPIRCCPSRTPKPNPMASPTRRIFVTREWPGDAFERLAAAGHRVEIWPHFEAPPHAVLVEKARTAHVLITTVADPVDEAVLTAGDLLEGIAQAGAGTDNIDLGAARAQGVWVTNAPGVLAEATADHAFALLLAVARRVVEGMAYVQAGSWTTWHPKLLLGPELSGATVGVVGLGSIGAAFARRCEGFDMQVLYTATAPKADADRRGYRYCALEELLAESDFVSLHLPLTPETTRLLDARRLGQMKPGALLINTARGDVVDTEALLEVLASGHLGGAGLDVTAPEPLPADHPLLTCAHVIVTPHIASAGARTRARMAALAVDNTLAHFSGGAAPNPVS